MDKHQSYLPPPAQQLLAPAQLAQLQARSNWRGVWLVCHCWGVIFAAMAGFAIFPHPISFILAVMLIGSRQLGLAVLMHDAAHGALTKSPRLNFVLSQWLCAYPVLADTFSYRRYHLKHHANVQQENDPDLILSAPFPITRKSLRRKIWRDLSGQTGWKQRKAQFINALGPRTLRRVERLAHFWDKFKPYLLAQAILFALLALSGYWYFYFLFWVVPFLTWHQLATRLRNIAEHAMVPDDNDPFRNARTTKAGWITRALLAPYWVNYHVEHHLLMWAPCYRLPLLRRFLEANGFGDRIETEPSYLAVLRLAASRPNDQDRPGAIVHQARRRQTA